MRPISAIVLFVALYAGLAPAAPLSDNSTANGEATPVSSITSTSNSSQWASQTATSLSTGSSVAASASTNTSNYDSGDASHAVMGNQYSSGVNASTGQSDSQYASGSGCQSAGSAAANASSSWASSTASGTTSYSMPSNGSGGSNWASNFGNCVSQCVASYGGQLIASPMTAKPTKTSKAASGSSAKRTTHTVIVAPTQGVLRYVPFALNASVGDTIQFMWGANNHTVTKSSALEPCNKSSAPLFASGTHDQGFSFTQVVNDTNPTFFYCATPGHCQKGMFGIINPPSASGASTSVSNSMASICTNSTTMSAYSVYTANVTSGNHRAAQWGSHIDMKKLPQWSHSLVAENVLYTRSFLGKNPKVMKDDGSIDLGSGSQSLMFPNNVGVAV